MTTDSFSLADLSSPHDSWVAAQGGIGGLGNTTFTTPTEQKPTICTKGTDGEEKLLELELKIIADVGLVSLMCWFIEENVA